MVLPVKHYVFTGLILLLMALDYLLIYQKMLFAIDLGLAGFLGIFQAPMPEDSYIVGEGGFGLTSTLLLMLFIVTVRVLNRHEGLGLIRGKVALRGTGLVLLAALLAALIWQFPSSIPHPFSIQAQFCSAPFQTDLKKIGDAMEKYAADNKGSYPGALTELLPGYLDRLPDYAPHLTRDDKAFYRSRKIPVPDLAYERDAAAANYTLTCDNLRNRTRYTYSNKEGFNDDYQAFMRQ
ncbi:MAG: hypothetical protein RDV48_20465 [Candidatus Eremiobacteraeota bacterium]|nr:hypothetical protein [Candidatus Eremiobacteraeota bacterium]